MTRSASSAAVHRRHPVLTQLSLDQLAVVLIHLTAPGFDKEGLHNEIDFHSQIQRSATTDLILLGWNPQTTVQTRVGVRSHRADRSSRTLSEA